MGGELKEASIIWECCRTNNLERLHPLLEKIKQGCKTKQSLTETLNFSPCKAGTTALTIASGKGYLEVVRLLLNYGADANVKNKDGTSPLHRACEHGHLDIMKLLLDSGAHVNAVDTEGNTPLHLVAATSFLDPIGILIEQGADLQMRNCGSMTAYQIAKFCENNAAITLLYETERDNAIYNHVFERSLMKKVIKKWHEIAQQFFLARKEQKIIHEQTH